MGRASPISKLGGGDNSWNQGPTGKRPVKRLPTDPGPKTWFEKNKEGPANKVGRWT